MDRNEAQNILHSIQEECRCHLFCGDCPFSTQFIECPFMNDVSPEDWTHEIDLV